jgi:hypothetical protein
MNRRTFFKNLIVSSIAVAAAPAIVAKTLTPVYEPYNVEQRLADILSKEIQDEIDKEMINRMAGLIN